MFGDDNRSALLSAVLSVDPEDMGARQTVAWMRDHLPDAAGASARHRRRWADRADQGLRRPGVQTQPLVFVFVALIAFVMLLISIRSVFLAFKGVLMTVLSVAAAYGSLVVVFQWGWLEELGFEPITSMDSTIPPLVLAMTFGLSMDYEIFLLTRIRERFLQSSNTRDAVAYGVSTSARTITSAALIMIAVFIGFAFAGMPLVAEIGVACAVAIAVDATVVRLVMVPALMAMFDEWNWWLPAWLDRILPSVDFEKPLPKVDLGDLVMIPDDISALGCPAPTCASWSSRRRSSRTWPRRDHRRRPAGVQRLWPRADRRHGQGQRLRREHGHPSLAVIGNADRARRHGSTGSRRRPNTPQWRRRRAAPAIRPCTR